MKNKKPILIALAVLFLLLLVFVAWKITGKKSAQNLQTSRQEQSQDAPESSPAETTTSVKGNLFDLVKLGKTLKCEYSMNTEGITVSGTSYISGSKMRGDYETADPSGNKIQSHMISDGEWVYTWTSALPQGYKVKVSYAESKTPTSGADTSTKPQYLDNFKDNVDFKCNPWTEDASLFKVPSDITFTDPSANLDIEEAMCAACNYAQTEEDKSACRTQLGCQ